MNEVESFFQIRIFQNAFKKLDVNRLSKHCPITSYEMTQRYIRIVRFVWFESKT